MEDDLEDATIDLSDFYAVVPAGGAGTRLWPLSRSDRPKFLLDLAGRGRTLIQSTWDRLLPLSTAERTLVVTGRSHVDAVREQLPDLRGDNVLAEPSRRESAAAIGLAAAVLVRRNPDAVIGSFAADQIISGRDDFEGSVEEAVVTARRGFVVTIGIAPSHPATAFGYIRLGKRLRLQGAPNARRVLQFKEKPDARTAAAYLSTGDYRWNGGMFVARADVLLELLSVHAPALHAGLQRIADAWDTPQRDAVLEEQWDALPAIAIDHAVAEPAAEEGRVAVVPATFGWDDVGDFSSLAELLPADVGRPHVLGDPDLVVTEGVAGGLVVPGNGRIVALLGVDDIVVVDTPDALLVTTRARSQEVKKLVSRLEEAGLHVT
ncbi:mannose-1-phosphate guanylyltransferase [Kineococcus rubinsiae]|uniref:mannose-1-phosphate guanylyltransferase n=1 Tax=Kineococcus rubinsiae TaxID=2609562 RepID=UPI00143033C8|nr:mannose-1-phosphate guanylyltransferase [Kineococcus rubinsiae]